MKAGLGERACGVSGVWAEMGGRRLVPSRGGGWFAWGRGAGRGGFGSCHLVGVLYRDPLRQQTFKLGPGGVRGTWEEIVGSSGVDW